MGIGLYRLKYPFRKLIEWSLPLVKDVSPNTISWLMLPAGLAAAFSFYFGFNGYPILLLVSFFLCFVRMFLGTLDGLMAVRFAKESPEGEIINRLTPELCDVFYLAALIFADPHWMLLGGLAIGMAWLTSFAGLIGAIVQKPIQSVGPVGQTDRLAAFMLFLLLQYLSFKLSWEIDFIKIFLAWCIVGGVGTVVYRLWRTLA